MSYKPYCSVADVIYAQMEHVRPMLQDWYEHNSLVSSRIRQQGKKVIDTTGSFRIPFSPECRDRHS